MNSPKPGEALTTLAREYSGEDTTAQNLRRLLVDIRHACDLNGIAFGDLYTASHRKYLHEWNQSRVVGLPEDSIDHEYKQLLGHPHVCATCEERRTLKAVFSAIPDPQPELEVKTLPHANPTALASLWLALQDIQTKLSNEVVPLATFLAHDEFAELIEMSDAMATFISEHFKEFKLQASRRGGL